MRPLEHGGGAFVAVEMDLGHIFFRVWRVHGGVFHTLKPGFHRVSAAGQFGHAQTPDFHAGRTFSQRVNLLLLDFEGCHFAL